jgi:hypothetical protein
MKRGLIISGSDALFACADTTRQQNINPNAFANRMDIMV